MTERTQWLEGLLFGEECHKMGLNMWQAFDKLGPTSMVEILEDGRKILFNPTQFHFGLRDYYQWCEENLK